MEGQTLTFGQKAVGINFNPGGDPAVNEVKQKFADIIDAIQNAPQQETTEPHLTYHIKGEAIRSAMTAQMWAVKLLTWKV